jgi:parallel beta-helix repeat protein
MKGKLWVLAMSLVMLLAVNPVWADGDFYVVVAGGEVGTKIKSLPYPISNPGFYYLDANLTQTATGDGITVNADDVVIDLMGFSLIGPGTVGGAQGIFMSGRKNVEIRNGTVRNYTIGISEVGGSNNRVISVKAQYNGYGIYLLGANNRAQNCNASYNTGNGAIGINVSSGMVTGCMANINNGVGINFPGPGRVTGNYAYGNSMHGFTLGTDKEKPRFIDNNCASNNTQGNYTGGLAAPDDLWGVNLGKAATP